MFCLDSSRDVLRGGFMTGPVIRAWKFEKLPQEIQDVVEYILEFEEDDFLYYRPEEPNKDHVYYKAYVVKFGRYEASKMLRDVLAERKEK